MGKTYLVNGKVYIGRQFEDRSLVFRSEKGFMEYSFFSKRLSTSPYFLPHRYHSLRKDTVSQIHEYF